MTITTSLANFIPQNPLMEQPNSADYRNSASPPPSSPLVAYAGIPVRSAGEYEPDEKPPQPQVPIRIRPKKLRPWTTGLCECTADVGNCCMTMWCPCVTFGRVAEIVDKGSNSCGVSGALYALIVCTTGCPCIFSCFYRSKMRQHYSLRGSPCGDCAVHCFCECCALCQEYRELNNRGFNVPLGWHGNMEKHNSGAETPSQQAPRVEGGMSR